MHGYPSLLFIFINIDRYLLHVLTITSTTDTNELYLLLLAASGFHKILKKHDRHLPNPCKAFYTARLHDQAWVSIIISSSNLTVNEFDLTVT